MQCWISSRQACSDLWVSGHSPPVLPEVVHHPCSMCVWLVFLDTMGNIFPFVGRMPLFQPLDNFAACYHEGLPSNLCVVNKFRVDFNPSSRSLLYSINSSCPNTDQCGTPLLTGSHTEACQLSRTRCFLPVDQTFIHALRLSPSPADLSFLRSRSCGTLPESFWKSR